MICHLPVVVEKDLEVLRVNVKQWLHEETAYSEDVLDQNLKIDAGCVLWVGLKNNKGYGKAWYPRTKKLILLHRLIWMKANKQDIPKGLNVLHCCDNPGCVNPNHLSADSQSKNIRDAFKRGRISRLGSQNPSAKINEDQVILIRKLYSGGALQKDLALQFGLKCNSISYIVTNRNWKNV